MRGWLMALMLAVPAMTGTASAQPLRTAQAGQALEWPTAPANARYRVADIILTMRNVVSGSDSEQLDRVLTVQARGLPAFTIESTEIGAFPPTVIVVPTRGHTPLIVYQTFSGGAHCCTATSVIEPRNGRLEAVPIFEGDGGPWEQAPRDIDGDGAVDFVFYDNSFLYTFASYAESAAPPIVINIVDGQGEDVSAKPGFRSLFEEEARRSRETCIASDSNRNGACASFVAASARLGRFDAAWAEMLRHWDREAQWELPTGCRVKQTSDGCPDDQKISYPDYPTALRAFLIEQGYIAH